MSYSQKNSKTTFVSIAVLILASLACWQFYKYATFKHDNGLLNIEGGVSHMMWALLLTVMNGLRMFIRPDKVPVENNVFYSQRSRGPMYRWYYEKHLAKWQVTRVDTSRWSSHELCTASWQSVPQELKAQLIEHYVE